LFHLVFPLVIITCIVSLNTIRVIKSRRIRWEWHVARMGDMRNAFKILVVEPERKMLRGVPRRRCEDNIRMDLREIAWEVVDFMLLA